MQPECDVPRRQEEQLVPLRAVKTGIIYMRAGRGDRDEKAGKVTKAWAIFLIIDFYGFVLKLARD